MDSWEEEKGERGNMMEEKVGGGGHRVRGEESEEVGYVVYSPFSLGLSATLSYPFLVTHFGIVTSRGHS